MNVTTNGEKIRDLAKRTSASDASLSIARHANSEKEKDLELTMRSVLTVKKTTILDKMLTLFLHLSVSHTSNVTVISAQSELKETALSTGNALNAWDTGTTQSLTLMEDLPALTAETTGDTAHGVPGTSTGDLTSVSNAKKEPSMTQFQETASVNAED